jgi:hypothetical protein
VLDDTVDVDHRHRDQRATQAPYLRRGEQPANDLDAVELVAMDRRTDEQARAWAPPMHHVHRHVELGVRDQVAHRQLDGLSTAGLDDLIA